MDDARTATVVRTLRVRRRWRQVDLAAAAGVPRGAVSLIERGHADALVLATTRRVCAALDIRLDTVPRWRGGDLDRVLNARHAAMAEATAAAFERLPGWRLRPEVSFSIYGERGVIDFVAWHSVRRALLLIELKTELVDIGDLMATADRRRRLAPRIARDLGWDPLVVGVWVLLRETTTNARRVREHRVRPPHGVPFGRASHERLVARPARSGRRPVAPGPPRTVICIHGRH